VRVCVCAPLMRHLQRPSELLAHLSASCCLFATHTLACQLSSRLHSNTCSPGWWPLISTYLLLIVTWIPHACPPKAPWVGSSSLVTSQVTIHPWLHVMCTPRTLQHALTHICSQPWQLPFTCLISPSRCVQRCSLW